MSLGAFYKHFVDIEDANSYFYLTVQVYDNHYQTYDAVEHPETREVIFVTPHPWTGWEHENAEW
ncbi:hypothetical protein HW423_01235 [Aerococcaceae bacterium INB8]|uniref:Uncharacterized protein n=1 Tax=Ruoffia halotolerans TaxID=2748684 RepID=A0A839A385_9LACT|nr:hypothetical protein [Ruoffia halotolerans]